MHRYPKSTLLGLLFLYVAIATSCRETNAIPTIPLSEEERVEVTYSSEPTPAEQPTLHTDTTHQYEFRTGTSGNYKYNYDVIGKDPHGNSVKGNVSMQGKYGAGMLLDYHGNEIPITLEWTGNGVLRAEDNDGNIWDLEVE